MAGNTFGSHFKITTYGESHGKAMGVIIDGCPSGLAIDEDMIQLDLDRRRPGQSSIVTQRKEGDRVVILSGVLLPAYFLELTGQPPGYACQKTIDPK